MRILIIEDEIHTANRLSQLIYKYSHEFEILNILPSVETAVKWLKENRHPDLIFQDIQLNDGICFDIYNAVEVNSPVIFTTAYSEYALRSFDLNSIGYIVKPYDYEDIKRVLDKFSDFSDIFNMPPPEYLKKILAGNETGFRKRFLVRLGDSFKVIYVSDIAYLVSDTGITFAYAFDGSRHIVDLSLNLLDDQLDNSEFFRINRNLIVNNRSIQDISVWFNGRLKLTLDPLPKGDIIVSRSRVRDFKIWLEK